MKGGLLRESCVSARADVSDLFVCKGCVFGSGSVFEVAELFSNCF